MIAASVASAVTDDELDMTAVCRRAEEDMTPREVALRRCAECSSLQGGVLTTEEIEYVFGELESALGVAYDNGGFVFVSDPAVVAFMRCIDERAQDALEELLLRCPATAFDWTELGEGGELRVSCSCWPMTRACKEERQLHALPTYL